MQSSVYHTSSKKIYYFGGYYNDINAVGTANLTFAEAIVFDTTTSTWGKQVFTGGVIPTVRRYHTMTLCKFSERSRDAFLVFTQFYSTLWSRYFTVWWNNK